MYTTKSQLVSLWFLAFNFKKCEKEPVECESLNRLYFKRD